MIENDLVRKVTLNIKKILSNKTIPMLFAIIIILGLFTTDKTPYFLMNEILQLFLRNAFFVLALLIPVRAGMGFNFSIIIGAMAGQLGVIAAIDKGFIGFQSFLIAVAFATPLAMFLGFFTGKLLNKACGHEMIASLFLSYFMNGIYQIICLFLIGGIIPVKSEELLLSSGVGLRNTLDLSGNLRGSVDAIFGGILQVPIFSVLFAFGIIAFVINFYLLSRGSSNTDRSKLIKLVAVTIVLSLFSFIAMYTDFLPSNLSLIKNVKLSLVTVTLLFVFIVINQLFTKSKFGESFQIISQEYKNDKNVGYQADKYRVASIMISIVLAAWGQIIYLQSKGMLITYGSHTGVGTLSVVALIIGGASIKRATVGQALLGTVLLQSFVILSSSLFGSIFEERNLFEVLRILILNGVILSAFIQTRRSTEGNIATNE